MHLKCLRRLPQFIDYCSLGIYLISAKVYFWRLSVPYVLELQCLLVRNTPSPSLSFPNDEINP